MQEHTGMWFTTSHTAFWPHVPGQGSLHLFFRQVLSRGHSELRIHSGRQASYGLPIYSGKHSQSPFLHIAFGPQGDGLHRSLIVGTVTKEKKYMYLYYNKFDYKLLNWHRNEIFVFPNKFENYRLFN